MWGLNYYVVFVLAAIFTGDGVAGDTLRITSADTTYSGTSDEGIIFSFCEGGSYCTPGDDDEVSLPSDSGIDVDGAEVVVTVSLEYEPTTMIITKSSDNGDAWHIVDVVWEDGDDLLGLDGKISLESEVGSGGCIDGLSDSEEDIACLGQWRFFNLNGDSNYTYDVRVLPCSGTGGATVKAHFCSHASCDGTAGEEFDVVLTTSSEEDSGWTLTQFSSDFNPVAMRLSEVDSNWCAEDMTFNLFEVGSDLNATAFDETVNGTACKIIKNLQYSGMTSTIAPTTAPIGASGAPSTSAPTTVPIASLVAPSTIAPTTVPIAPLVAPSANAPTPAPIAARVALSTFPPTTALITASVAPAQAAPAQPLNNDDEDSVWLDAAWEVTVTVIGGGVTAAASAAGLFFCVRRSSARMTETR